MSIVEGSFNKTKNKEEINMKTKHRIIAVLTLACVLATSAFAGSALAASKKKTGAQKSVPAKAATAAKQDTAASEQQKDLLSRLLESKGLTQKNVDDIKAYLQANPAAPAEGKAADNDSAVLNKLGALVKDGKMKQKALDALTGLVNSMKEKAGKDSDDIASKLTQTALDAMVKASVITEKEADAIVAQLTRDLLDSALKGKSLSQKDFDTIQAALKDAPAIKK